MTRDPTAPATKEDVRLLMEEIGRLYAANERWKGEIVGHMGAWKDELKEHFDVVAEDLRHDFRTALRDKIDQHEDRVVRLERRAGLRPA